MKITCQACDTDYFDPSPAAAAEPKPCPWCLCRLLLPKRVDPDAFRAYKQAPENEAD